MNRLATVLCRTPWIPLSLRRTFGRLLVPYSDESFEIEVGGVPYQGSLDNYIEWVAYVTGEYYEFTYLNLIRAFRLGGCALDVGANVGNHTTAFAGMFDEVLAFEPFPPVFARLERKVARLPGVRAFNVALGEADGVARFSPPRGSNLGVGRVEESGEVPVQVVHGDAYLAGRHRGPIRLIKVDVEGYEAQVLRGLSEALRRDRPVVLYEAPRAFRDSEGRSLADSFKLFPTGYEFWGLRGQTTFPVQRRVARPVRIGPDHARRRYASVLAVPRERSLLPLR